MGRKAKRHPYIESSIPLVFAHRGGSRLAPENTMVAFGMARNLNVDALELDIRPTRDGEAVVIHDETVDRTCDGHGRVSDKSLSELRSLDAGFHFTMDGGKTFPFRASGVKVPTLEEVIATFDRLRINVDVKETQNGLERRLAELVVAHRAKDRMLICSSEDHINKRLRESVPGVAYGATSTEVAKFWASVRLGLGCWYVPPVHAFQVPPEYYILDVVTQAFVQASHEAGIAIHVWTIDDEKEMRRLLELGVDGLMSDLPDRLILVRDEFARKRGLLPGPPP